MYWNCWLSDFVEKGWSTKRLIKTILLSRTYKQSSKHNLDAYAIDPENRLYWRAKRRRMDFESFRDALLVATGALDRSIGGPSVKIHVSPFSNRRTLYAYIDRQNLPSLFRTFDFASPDAHVPQRSETTVPPARSGSHEQRHHDEHSRWVLQEVRKGVGCVRR